MTGFTVDPAALRGHAAQVDAIGSMVRDASSAADAVGYGGLNYGIVASGPIQAALHGFLGDSTKAISSAADFATDMAGGLHRNADVYEQIEANIVSTFGS